MGLEVLLDCLFLGGIVFFVFYIFDVIRDRVVFLINVWDEILYILKNYFLKKLNLLLGEMLRVWIVL